MYFDRGMTHTLPELPYGLDSLEPYIDAETMQIHHTKHHQTYVDKLNDALKDQPDLADKPLEELLSSLDALPDQIRTAVRNNGGGHWNHSFFWKVMTPKAGGTPTGSLTETINKTFGSFENFKKEFTAAATGRFGSGWAWLVKNSSDELKVLSTPNQDNPITEHTGTPILGLDVWEHAYYLKYQNRRPEYVENWWNVVNWDQANTNFEAAK